jgi:SAM-dependent methyltransferase
MAEELFHDPELAQFYDLDNGWGADRDFCLTLAGRATSVLDLGCGTGELATVLAKTRRVTGVDPARAMLGVARSRIGGERVQWVETDARTVRLGERFGLVVMTGHAFQCLLTEDDQLAVCRTIAAHLAPGGTFIFDSRNPAVEEWRDWVPEKSRGAISHPELGDIETWNDARFDHAAGIATYETFYRSARSGRTWRASSRIRFSTREEIAAGIAGAGLRVDRWMGDWAGGPLEPLSPEIIPVGGLAD